MQRYGKTRPPVYDLTKIPRDFPMLLVYGRLDELADYTDVQHIIDDLQLHNVQTLYIRKYAHEDFVNAVDAKDLVYNQIVKYFQILKEE